jgi:parallel beta-helix repeat protein
MSHMPATISPTALEFTRGIVSVKDYGAKGDGVTDDTAALAAALTAAAGKTLLFPTGTYRCSTVLTPAAGTRIRGEGGAELVFIDDGSAAGIRLLIQVADVVVENLSLRDTSTARTGVYGLVSIVNCSHARVLDCVFGNSSSTAIYAQQATDFELRGNIITGTRADGIHISRASKRGVVANNIIRNTGDDGIGVISNRTLDGSTACDPCERITITGNVISAPTPIGRGIALDGSRHITVTGNLVCDTPNQGILAGGGGTSYYPAFLTIANNTIVTPTSAGIHVTYTRNLVVDGNNVYDSTDVGISLIGAAYGARVANNTMNRCARSIVVTQTASNDATLLADLFTNLGDTAPSKMVIDRLAITDNTITAQDGATSTCISIVGESSDNAKRVVVAANAMQVITGGTGIALSYAEDPLVSHNSIDGDTKGISLAEVDRGTVFANHLRGCYLELVTNSTDAVLLGNHISGATASAIFVDGTSTGTYAYDNDVRNSTAPTFTGATTRSRNMGITPVSATGSRGGNPGLASLLTQLAAGGYVTDGTTTINEIVPNQITADQNNYSPTSFSTADIMYLTSDAARNVTGIAARSAMPHLWVYNGGAFNITLKHQSASSSAANRITGRGNADTVLTPGTCAHLIYSTAAGSVWVVITDTL